MKKLSLLLAVLLILLAGCGNSSSVSVATTATELTREQAEAIALEHAGLTADQVTRLHSEKDREQGGLHYDIEFHHDGWEYDYAIDAATGSILSQEKDHND